MGVITAADLYSIKNFCIKIISVPLEIAPAAWMTRSAPETNSGWFGGGSRGGKMGKFLSCGEVRSFSSPSLFSGKPRRSGGISEHSSRWAWNRDRGINTWMELLHQFQMAFPRLICPGTKDGVPTVPAILKFLLISYKVDFTPCNPSVLTTGLLLWSKLK